MTNQSKNTTSFVNQVKHKGSKYLEIDVGVDLLIDSDHKLLIQSRDGFSNQSKNTTSFVNQVKS